MSTIITNLIAGGSLLSLVILGGFALYGLFDKTKRERKTQEDGVEDRLIKLLNETNQALEEKLKKQKEGHDEVLDNLTKQIQELSDKVDDLESENETLVKVLQGRDEQTQLFYKKAFEAMEIGNKTHGLVVEMNKNQTDLMKVLIEHLKPGVTVNVPGQHI